MLGRFTPLGQNGVCVTTSVKKNVKDFVQVSMKVDVQRLADTVYIQRGFHAVNKNAMVRN